MINLGPLTEREARDIIRGIQETNPELARVLRLRVDTQTGFTHPGQTSALHPAHGRTVERVTDVMFGRAR